MKQPKLGFIFIASVAVAIIVAVTGAVYACPQTGGVDCSGERIELQLKDQDQSWADGVNKTWTAFNMAPGQTYTFTGNFVGLRSNVFSLAQISCDYQVTKGLPDHMAQQMILTGCIYGGSMWKIDCLTGNWQLRATGSHPLMQGTNLQWKLADTDHDGAVTFYDLKKDPINNLPLPDSSISDSTQFQIGVKFAAAAGNDLQNNTLNMNMNFTASAWDNSCGNYGIDAKTMQLFLGQASKPVCSSMFITSSLNPAVFGQAVTFTAKVTGEKGTPTGTVTFSDGSNALGSVDLNASGQAVIIISSLGIGNHTIKATYGGNTIYLGSSDSLTETVKAVKTNTATLLVSSGSPSVFGQSVTFTATVTGTSGTPTGTVTYKDGGTILATKALNSSGKAAFSTSSLNVSGSPHAITVVYSGDAKNNGSSSNTVSQVVKLSGSSTMLNGSMLTIKSGNTVSFTAVVSSIAPGDGNPGGSVTFYDGSVKLGSATLNNCGKATYSTSKLSGGTHNITAVYAGDTNFTTSTSNVIKQVIK